MTLKKVLGPIAIAIVLLVVSGLAQAKLLEVGPGKPYATVNAAIDAAATGDTIEIQPGIYENDFATISTGNLTIRGVGSTRPHLRSTVTISNGKGIFVVSENTGPITIENLEFSGARVNDQNGAGIRMQGSAVTVRNCYFHDNENGILSGGTDGYTAFIETSIFENNGRSGSGYQHNMYIGSGCAKFTLQHSYSHHAKSGHNVKSRADVNYILYNRIMDEADGTASYAIDLPQGGRSYVIGNLIQQGPLSENNGSILRYKAETPTNDELDLYVVNNTFVNDNSANATFVNVSVANTVWIKNNLFVGPGSPYSVPNGTSFSETANIATDAPNLVDRSAYEYRLSENSIARNKGEDPGTAEGFSLTPTFQYVHIAGREPRTVVGTTIDVGAYEYGAPVIQTDAGPADATTDAASTLDGGVTYDATVIDGSPDSRLPSSVRPREGCDLAVAENKSANLWIRTLFVMGMLFALRIKRRKRVN